MIARRGTFSWPKKSLAASIRVTRSSVISRVRLSLAGAGLVEADVPGAADAQELNVDAARLGDLLFVPAAVVVHLLDRQRAIGHVPVAGRDVDQVEQVLAHEADVALQLVRLHRVVFVEVERDDVRERQPFFAVQPHQLVVDADRRAAGRQAQHAIPPLGRPLANQIGNLSGHRLVGLRRMRKHTKRDVLALRQRVELGRGAIGSCGATIESDIHCRDT